MIAQKAECKSKSYIYSQLEESNLREQAMHYSMYKIEATEHAMGKAWDSHNVIICPIQMNDDVITFYHLLITPHKNNLSIRG